MNKVLSLSGGATKISFLSGAAIGLCSKKKYTDYIGTSSGAILAFCLAVGKHEEVRKKSVEFRVADFMAEDPASLWGKIKAAYRLVSGKAHLFDQSPLAKTLKKVVTNEDFDRWISDKESPNCAVSMVCLETGEIQLIDLKSMSYKKAIKCVMASSSLPVFTEPIYLFGGHYVDGGLRAHNPANEWLKNYFKKEPVEIDVVFSRPKSLDFIWKYEPRVLPIAKRTLDILMWEISKSDEEELKHYGGHRISIYYSPRRLDVRTYETSPRQNQEFYNLGLRAVERIH